MEATTAITIGKALDVLLQKYAIDDLQNRELDNLYQRLALYEKQFGRDVFISSDNMIQPFIQKYLS